MGLLQEFVAFAVKGNVIDMAVGIVIGAAFGKIVSSLVADIIMPPLGLLIGGVDFTGLKYVLKEATRTSDAGVKAINLIKEDVEAIAAKATEITSTSRTPRSSSKSRKSK